MLNNVYTDKSSGEQVRILNEEQNFYVLDNSVRIKKDIFTKRYEIKEEIDPNSFFQVKSPSTDPLYNLASQIKNLDSSKVQDTPSPGAQVKYTPPVVLSDNSMSQAVLKQQRHRSADMSVILQMENQWWGHPSIMRPPKQVRYRIRLDITPSVFQPAEAN